MCLWLWWGVVLVQCVCGCGGCVAGAVCLWLCWVSELLGYCGGCDEVVTLNTAAHAPLHVMAWTGRP